MIARFSPFLLAMISIGCSKQPSILSRPAIDLVQSGKETAWNNGITLNVAKRAENSLEGIRLVDQNAKTLLVSATGSISSGSIDNPKHYNCITITLTNARSMTIDQGQGLGATAGLTTLVLRR